MVNYHTSTLLESSEHVFELIRYNFFWGAPPYSSSQKSISEGHGAYLHTAAAAAVQLYSCRTRDP